MSVLGLDAAKAHLNIERDTYDQELPSFIAAAEALVARRVGPLEIGEFTETLRGGRSALIVSKLPLVEVSGVEDQNGTAVDVSLLAVDPSGIVAYANGVGRFGSTSYTVTYDAGYGTVTGDEWDGPADMLHAIKETVRSLWESSQRGSGARPGSPQSTELSNTLTGSAYVLPSYIQRLIDPYVPLGGF